MASGPRRTVPPVYLVLHIMVMVLLHIKSDPVSLDTVWTTMTAAKEAGHEGQDAKSTTTPGRELPPPSEGLELPERWSVQRKTELVLRLLRGEALDAVSRESQVPAHELEAWKRVFLDQGARGLKTRSDPEERELTLARAKIGELMMRLELAEYLIEKRGLADEWKKQRR